MSNENDRSAATRLGAPDRDVQETRPIDVAHPSIVPTQLVAEPSAGGVPDGTPLPASIGRYRVEGLLGSGGFGRVYRGFDQQMGRPVAIKVPDPRMFDRGLKVESYLHEARIVAQLDHSQIVPVYDVGSTAEWPCFVVSKLVAGGDLASRIRQTRLNCVEAARMTAVLSGALHHAHKQGVVHRDIKPSNILLDELGNAYLTDFGLALDEASFGRGPRHAGTPAYMSPEQARGEGHRVDGRSDIYSLGVVLYELLTGRRPFRSEDPAELLEQIVNLEPRPLRQIDDSIPRELERICLRALAKRTSERYLTAQDLADDLQLALERPASTPVVLSQPATGAAEGALSTPALATPSTEGRSSSIGPSLSSEGQPVTGTGERSKTRPEVPQASVTIVPRGLRSFDGRDADFFLELLPGARDRDGIPYAVQFWKKRIETSDADTAFAVGLLYGPSGCGKSSLVKAGLIPRLNAAVIPLYLEATSEGTEQRLRAALRNACAGLSGTDLVQDFALLRKGDLLSAGRSKVVVFIDQFEQWLHAHRAEEDTLLAQALRQCDGVHVQCVLLVRDDFWMSITRFLRELEVRLVEGVNSAAVDLFGPRHARRVLAAFGRAYDCLPADFHDEDEGPAGEFLNQAVNSLAEGGTIIPVRLALLADMLKGKPWTPESLAAMGGAEGIGATFLEETFSSSTAPPAHRYHQQAARRVLKTLLYVPGEKTSIKGRMRSRAELMDAAGYTPRPRDFDDLLRILDGDLRLITPTEAGVGEGVFSEQRSQPGSPTQKSNERYQLTHDYLVPALREWLTRKQRETARGRAELRLEERTELWTARPLASHLPRWWEVGNILALTRWKLWTPEQRQMMRGALRRVLAECAVLTAVLVIAGMIAYELNGRIRSAALAERIVQSEIPRLPQILEEFEPYRRWGEPWLHSVRQQATPDSRSWVNANLALARHDPEAAVALIDRAVGAEPQEFSVLSDSLAGQREAVTDRLWSIVETPAEESARRLGAARLLAKCSPAPDRDAGEGESPRWSTLGRFLVRELIATAINETGRYQRLRDELAPAAPVLLPELQRIYHEQGRDSAERAIALNIAETYGAGHPQVLADVLLSSGDPERFARHLPRLESQRDVVLPYLREELDRDADAALMPEWNEAPFDPVWSEPAEDLVRQLEAGLGLVGDRFAFCQTVPLAGFELLVEELRRSGFRPIRCRPFPADGELRVAAVWRRDSLDWRLRFGLTAEQAQATVDDWARDGYFACDLTGYLDGTLRFVVLAVKDPEVQEVTARVGMRSAALDANFQASNATFASQNMVLDEAGLPAFTWVLHNVRNRRYALVDYQGVSQWTFARQQMYSALPLFDLVVCRAGPMDDAVEAAQANLQRIEAQLQEDPGNADLRMSRGAYRELLESPQAALEDFDFAVDRLPRSVRAVGRRATLLARVGRANEARAELRRLDGLNVDPYEFSKYSAMVAACLGDEPDAFGRFEVLARRLQRQGIPLNELTVCAAWCADAATPRDPARAREYALSALASLRDSAWIDPRNTLGLLSLRSLNTLPEYRQFLNETGADRTYLSTWTSSPGRVSRALYGRSPGDLLPEMKSLAAAGWRPLSISVASLGPEQLVSASAWQLPVVGDERRDQFALREAHAALLAARLGDHATVDQALSQTREPRVREFVMARWATLGPDPQTTVSMLRDSTTPAMRQALLLSLADYSADRIDDLARHQVESLILDWHRNDIDAGVHSAADWLLRQWGRGEDARTGDAEQAVSAPVEGRGWYVNRHGDTLTVVTGPVEFRMGSPDSERGKSFDERLHVRQIERTFAVATKEVTCEQFARFLAAHPELRQQSHRPAADEADALSRPVPVTWWEAAQYCRWLSEQEGIPADQMCYPPIAEIREGMVLQPPELRTGYRLPTEAEWEFCVRAGTESATSYGSTGELAARYARHARNSGDQVWPTGSLRPNRLGLFDMYGNALEWCHNLYVQQYPDPLRGPVVDLGRAGTVTANPRVLRGGWYEIESSELRSANRFAAAPNQRLSGCGFRVARTVRVIPPGQSGEPQRR